MAKKNSRRTDHLAQPTQPLPVEDHAVMPAPAQRSTWLWRGLAGLFLVAVCVALYGRTLDYPMVFDDEMYLRNNPLAGKAESFGYLGNIREFANHPAKLGLDPDLATNFIMPRRVCHLLPQLLVRWLPSPLVSGAEHSAARRQCAPDRRLHGHVAPAARG